jgi:hypothetical protein
VGHAGQPDRRLDQMVIKFTCKDLGEETIDAGKKGSECLTGTGRRSKDISL